MSIQTTSIRAIFLPDDPLTIARFGWSAFSKRYYCQVVSLDLEGDDDLIIWRQRIHSARGVAAILAPWVTLDAATIHALELDAI